MQSAIRAFIERRFLRRAAAGAVDEDSPLFSSGIVDSFGVLELIAFLEETFGVDVNVSQHELSDFDTIRKIARLVAELPSTR